MNWALDKILLSILAVLAIRSYNSIEDAVAKVSSLEGKQTLIEYRLTMIEHKIDLK